MTPAEALAGALGSLIEVPGRLDALDARLARIEEQLGSRPLPAASAPAPSPADLLTTEEAATIAKVRTTTVRAWIREGRLRASSPAGSRRHLVQRADLLALLRGGNGPQRVDVEALADDLLRGH